MAGRKWAAAFEKWWIKRHLEHDVGNWKKKSKAEKDAIKKAYNDDYWNPKISNAAIRAIGKRPQRDESAARLRVRKALASAMRELLRPVFVRDVAVNLLGRLEDSEVTEPTAEPSKYAGYGIPLKAMDELVASK